MGWIVSEQKEPNSTIYLDIAEFFFVDSALSYLKWKMGEQWEQEVPLELKVKYVKSSSPSKNNSA